MSLPAGWLPGLLLLFAVLPCEGALVNTAVYDTVTPFGSASSLTGLVFDHYGSTRYCEAIAWYNGLDSTDRPQPGKLIALPDIVKWKQARSFPHRVNAGQTLAAIARTEYGDEKFAAVLAVVNNLSPAPGPLEGKTVWVPDLARISVDKSEKTGDEQLLVSGQVGITLSGGGKTYPRQPIVEKRHTADPLELKQDLQLKITGRVQDNLSVFFDYEQLSDRDELLKEPEQKLKVVYTGRPGEVLSKLTFGDLDSPFPASEFLVYNKKLFGIAAHFGTGRFRFTALGSITRGQSGHRVYTGNTHHGSIQIHDSDWLHRMYFSIDLPQDAVDWQTLNVGDAEVFINDHSDSVTSWEQLVPGRDYLLDYGTGILRMLRSVKATDELATCFTLVDSMNSPAGTIGQNGQSCGISHCIYRLEDGISTELKNRYNLGSRDIARTDFILSVYDPSWSRTDADGMLYIERLGLDSDGDGVVDHQNIDFSEGILTFPDPGPFDELNKGAYEDPPESTYIIYAEYDSLQLSYFLDMNVLAGTDIVTVDGRTLTRNVDYFIDYNTGFVLFASDSVINENSRIVIDYEHMPLGAMASSTMVAGGRLDLDLASDAQLSLTALSHHGLVSGIPDLDNQPYVSGILDAHLVLDADDGNVGGRRMPFPFRLDIEAARSDHDPNAKDYALVNDMEATLTADRLGTSPLDWSIASVPPGCTSWSTRGMISLDEETALSSDFGKQASSMGMFGLLPFLEKVLKINYEFSAQENWTGIQRLVDGAGKPWTDDLYFEFWYRPGQDMAEILHVDLGSVAEDTDGDGLETEDSNNDGQLSEAEDTGFLSGATTWGAGNQVLDREDLDGDGQADAEGEIISVKVDLTAPPAKWEATPPDLDSGWKRLRIPMSDFSGSAPAIRYARLWIEKSETGARSSSFWLRGPALVRCAWSKAVAPAPASAWAGPISESSSSSYEPLDNWLASLDDKTQWRQLFKAAVDEDTDESSLTISVTNLAPGTSCYSEYIQPVTRDFTSYDFLDMYIHGDGSGLKAFVEWGSDESNLFRHEIPLDFKTWRAVSVDLNNAEVKIGTPSDSNVRILRIGLVNNGSAAAGTSGAGVWFDDIVLRGARITTGKAVMVRLKAHKGSTSFDFLARRKSSGFDILGDAGKAQDIQRIESGLGFTGASHLGIQTRWYSESVITGKLEASEATRSDLGKVITDGFAASAHYASGARLPELTCNWIYGLTSRSDLSSPDGGLLRADETRTQNMVMSWDPFGGRYLRRIRMKFSSGRQARRDRLSPGASRDDITRTAMTEADLVADPKMHVRGALTASDSHQASGPLVSDQSRLSLHAGPDTGWMRPRFALEQSFNRQDDPKATAGRINLEREHVARLGLGIRLNERFRDFPMDITTCELTSSLNEQWSNLDQEPPAAFRWGAPLDMDVPVSGVTSSNRRGFILAWRGISGTQNGKLLDFFNRVQYIDSLSYSWTDSRISGTRAMTETIAFPNLRLTLPSLGKSRWLKGRCEQSSLIFAMTHKLARTGTDMRTDTWTPSVTWKTDWSLETGTLATLDAEHSNINDLEGSGHSRQVSIRLELDRKAALPRQVAERIGASGSLVNIKTWLRNTWLNVSRPADGDDERKTELRTRLSWDLAHEVQSQFNMDAGYTWYRNLSGKPYLDFSGWDLSFNLNVKF